MRHNVTVPVYSIVVNEDSNVDARTLPIVKSILHENESIEKIIKEESKREEGKSHVEKSHARESEKPKVWCIEKMKFWVHTFEAHISELT